MEDDRQDDPAEQPPEGSTLPPFVSDAIWQAVRDAQGLYPALQAAVRGINQEALQEALKPPPAAQLAAEAIWGTRRRTPRRDTTPPPHPVPPQPPTTSRPRPTRTIFRDRDHFYTSLLAAMRLTHDREQHITRVSVAGTFQQSGDPRLRSCSDRRIYEWCSPKRFDVDFDALAREVESAG
jgi:hypothetical protein